MDGEIMMATNAGQSLTNQILTDSSIGSPQQNAWLYWLGIHKCHHHGADYNITHYVNIENKYFCFKLDLIEHLTQSG